jgi:hypothetical protein
MRIPDSVTVLHNRYVTASGSMAFCASNRALLWIDTNIAEGARVPRVIFTVLDVWTDARHIWIMDNLSIAGGNASEPPVNFRVSLSRWLRSRKPLFWDGGLVQQISLNQTSLANPLTPASYGIPLYRCEAGAS